MNNIIIALIVVLSINVLMFSSQSAVCEIMYDTPQCPAGAERFYTSEGGIVEHRDMNTTNVYGDLPTTGGAVQSDSGAVFTDVTGTILSWLGKVPGFDTLVGIVKAPYFFLKVMQLPEGWANLLATLWYLVTLALLFLVITGRY